MQHLKRGTDERVGLILAVVILLSFIYSWVNIGEIFSVLLIVFFLFRRAWGKQPVRQLPDRKRQ